MRSTKNQISVLLGLNFTSHLYDHAFKYSKSVLINVCKFSSLCAIWPMQVSSANSLPKPVKKQITRITFADISKAFDIVWIKALILKLENYGIQGKLLFWLKSYLSRRKQRVVIKDAIIRKLDDNLTVEMYPPI
jgi:hypothetical protein